MEKDEFHNWIIEVSLARTFNDLNECLSDMLIEEKHKCKKINFSEAVIGHYYIMYLDNKLNVIELLLNSAEEAEEGLDIGSEPFYVIKDLIEENSQGNLSVDIQQKIAHLFCFFFKIAKQQEEYLKNF
ncbi:MULTISPECIES: hypothetical protein [Saccharibacillus]|uniref:hypothetical protein n=1 Tax=Saccharibacillus TaxID=456492 RepID=UPI00123BB480|nr:hypothetical protein [Saccharibacillus sp. WB 17]MWJ31916.1 hypothetical protein [Saccharibacillus sp. WB 17]